MVISLTLNELVLFLLGIAGFVLIIFLIIAVSRLSDVLKRLSLVLNDAQVVSSIAADKAQKVDGIVDDASLAFSSLAANIKGNQSTIKALTTLVNSIGSLKSIFGDGTKR